LLKRSSIVSAADLGFAFRASTVLVLLLSCAPGPPTSLSILVRAGLLCSVKGVVHSVVQDLQFLDNFSHGIGTQEWWLLIMGLCTPM
jgi:hypothetical protein